MDLTGLLREMGRSIDTHPEGDLVLGWRLRLWDAMNRAFGSEALYRRSSLAYLVTRELIPVWNAGKLTDPMPEYLRSWWHAIPAQCLDTFLASLLDEADEPLVAWTFDFLEDALVNMLTSVVSENHMNNVCLAILHLQHLRTGKYDEELEEWCVKAPEPGRELEITEASLDWLCDAPGCHEPHYLATLIACEDLPREEAIAKRRDIWQDWLRNKLPAVLGPMEELRARLRACLPQPR